MTRRKQLWMGLSVVVLFLPVAFFPGCTKKASIKNETTASREQIPMVQAAPVKPAAGDKKAREITLREQDLREQALRDRAARGEKPGNGKGEVTGNKAAKREELHIPDIHFGFDEYNLKPESQTILKAGARAYLQNTQYELLIEGHCDDRGTLEYNLALGQRRADEAARFLIDLGVAKERIKTISYGEARPLDPGHDEAALARNRRDHFVVSQSVKQPSQ